MTQVIEPLQERRHNWVARVRSLADQITGWCQAQGWALEREEKVVRERSIGEYTVPALRAYLPRGEIRLNPIALDVIGSDGRVDLEAFPTLSRVKLIMDDGGWKIMTDSNVPLRQPWDQHTFVQLVQDLLS